MKKFWEEKTLAEISADEWEQLCDGCARCCVLKEQDEDTGEVTYTNIACRYLNLESCNCTCYEDRKELVPECINLSPKETKHFAWLPSTCAYRLLHEGQALPKWHPLISGAKESTKDAGMSIRNRVVSEKDIMVDG